MLQDWGRTWPRFLTKLTVVCWCWGSPQDLLRFFNSYQHFVLLWFMVAKPEHILVSIILCSFTYNNLFFSFPSALMFNGGWYFSSGLDCNQRRRPAHPFCTPLSTHWPQLGHQAGMWQVSSWHLCVNSLFPIICEGVHSLPWGYFHTGWEWSPAMPSLSGSLPCGLHRERALHDHPGPGLCMSTQ